MRTHAADAPVLIAPSCAPLVSDNSIDNALSLRDTVVVIQQTAHTRRAANRPAATGSPERLNQFVANALMVPLTVVVRHELRNRAAKIDRTTPLPIAITDQHTTTSQDAIEPIGQMTHGLFGRCCSEVAPKVTASLTR